jgi:hypothetical protein
MDEATVDRSVKVLATGADRRAALHSAPFSRVRRCKGGNTRCDLGQRKGVPWTATTSTD